MRWLLLVMASLLLSPLGGCSVGMALSGQKEPDLTVVRPGASRGEVEVQLGQPKKTVGLDSGRRMDTYEYEIGNEPNGGRALGHATMDVFTFGVWEIVGTPMEVAQGQKHEVTITYDSTDRVQRIIVTGAPPNIPQSPGAAPGSTASH